MIIDRTHLRWGFCTAVASAGSAVLYFANTRPELLPFRLRLPDWFGPIPPLRDNFGATPLGLAYGTVALLIFVFAALLGWRRNHPSLKVGRIKAWLKAHIWLTVLTLPLILFHCGFRGGGPLTQFLLWLYALVMVSGFVGLILQNVVPKIMRDYLPEEVIFEEMPFLRTQIISQGEALRQRLITDTEEYQLRASHAEGGAPAGTISRAHAVDAFIRFLDVEALPYLANRSSRRVRLRDRVGAHDIFRLLKLQIPEAVHPALEELKNLCDEKRRIDFQTRLHYWLHLWLLVHAPASLLLVVMTILHAIVAVYLYA